MIKSWDNIRNVGKLSVELIQQKNIELILKYWNFKH